MIKQKIIILIIMASNLALSVINSVKIVQLVRSAILRSTKQMRFRKHLN
ncbi:Putative uncharacterized protein [Lactobacillus helveticus CIRM-BIA 951]|uniref:Uncharacterized protein n=2 Tax=Lactobacillus helveticus TaxID=1587 RepID=U6F916_LACHE|nr:hypothetical protein HMPREF0518_1052 [Lactobacillus helveticus DSM 20075 = CGMCC 1.1877]CDI58884.1 Putative uncharacterized protein [Lactobacillus helveticus CIRM-BIA 951]CDI60211.1 Putative uncharacterized protein [Lactobacillus helveticus CIRM-BIA 104]CDI60668.1 Putative uncharacterized protein [Lactobacillus helveticus CIRM-BIA 104]CDI61927.1 Putative uncharacterized protein [Lactobacillus helveticus CIRM-BIA 103]